MNDLSILFLFENLVFSIVVSPLRSFILQIKWRKVKVIFLQHWLQPCDLVASLILILSTGIKVKFIRLKLEIQNIFVYLISFSIMRRKIIDDFIL